MRPGLSIVLLCAGMGMGGCVVAPYGGYRHGGYAAPVQAEVMVAPYPPPPDPVEVITPMPFAGALWIGGYWGWHLGRHQWIGGRWDHPRPGYVWQPRRWEPTSGGWRAQGGGWRGR
jgi:hypothetical protein